jgi:hypothetical protein
MQGNSKRPARLGVSSVKTQFVTGVNYSANEHGEIQCITGIRTAGVG